MEVTRTFLRSETGDVPKQVRMAGSITQTKGKYGEELRGQLNKLGDVRRKSPVIQSKRVDPFVSEPEQYTQEAIKTALKKLGLAVQEGIAKEQSGTSTTQPTTSGGGGGGGNKGYFSGSDLSGMSTQQLVDRDNRMYGNTFPEGSFSPTDTGAMVNRDKMMYGNTFPEGSFNITKPKEETSMGTTFTGIGTKEFTKAFTEKQKEQPKQTVAALPSNYKETEKAAFDKAKSWQDSKAKGEAATKATGIPSGSNLKAGSFGISAEGKKTAEANRAEAKKKAQAQKKSSPSTTKSSPSSSASKKGSTGSKKSSRGAKGSSSSRSKGGTSKGGAKGKSSGSRGQGGGTASRSKGGSFGGKRRSSNTKKSRRRCDIRCKFDISILTNQNLIRDDLADVAYFVKDLQEIN
tara:strand:- start:102 stop:1313 length:1212 start_codon:yes stop_codon:yes gene_type:complete